MECTQGSSLRRGAAKRDGRVGEAGASHRSELCLKFGAEVIHGYATSLDSLGDERDKTSPGEGEEQGLRADSWCHDSGNGAESFKVKIYKIDVSGLKILDGGIALGFPHL